MVADSTDKNLEESDQCKSRASTTKEIPRWNSVTNPSCTRLNELFCCDKVAHSVFFYVLLFLFLLIFVYILRKLVSFPGGHSKLNGRKLSNHTAVTVHNDSSNTLAKKRPTKWPKIDKIVDHLYTHPLTPTAITHINNQENRIYSVYGEGKPRHGLSGLVTENPDSNSGQATQVSNLHQAVESYRQGSGMVYPKPQVLDEELLPKSLFQEKVSPTSMEPNIADASGEVGRGVSSWSSNEDDGLKKPSTISPMMHYNENNGFGNTYNEWSKWNYPGDMENDMSTSKYIGNSALANTNNRLPAFNSASYSDSNVHQQSDPQFSQNGVSEFQNQIMTPGTNGGNYGKMGYNSLPWSTLDSGSPTGSGFGWVRSGKQDSKDSYQSYSSFPMKNRYFDQDSGRWAYSGDNADTNPTSESYNNAKPDQTKYDNSFGANSWNPNNSHEKMNGTEDWNNNIALNDQRAAVTSTSNFGDLKGKDISHGKLTSWTVNNDKDNERYHGPAQVKEEEIDETVHRWLPHEVRTKEADDQSSSKLGRIFHKKKHRHTFRRRATHRSKKKYKSSRPNVRKHRRIKANASYKLKTMKWKGRLKNTFVKKSKIPYHAVLKKHKKKRHVKHLKVKLKVTQKFNANLKRKPPQLLPKVSHLKEHLNKRRLRTSIDKHISQHLRRPFASYTSYKNFIKRHKVNDVLVRKWKHKIHHVQQCKALSTFKAQGEVKFRSQYFHRTRKYKYTIVSCKSVHKAYDESYHSDNKRNQQNAATNRICREFWFITTGRIILRKVTRNRRENTFSLTLCQRKNIGWKKGRKIVSSVIRHDNDDEKTLGDNSNEDSDLYSRTEKNDDDYDDDDDDVDDDDDNDDDDDDNNDDDLKLDTDNVQDNKGPSRKTKQTNILDENDDDDNEVDLDDNSYNDDELDLDDDDSKNVSDDDDNDDDEIDRNSSETSKDHENNRKNNDNDADVEDFVPKSIHNKNKESDFDNELENVDDGKDANNEHSRKRTHRKLTLKAKKRKSNRHKTNARKLPSPIQKSFMTKRFHKHLINRKNMKLSERGKHTTSTSKDYSDNENNIYKHLLKELTKKHRTMNARGALLKLIATLSHKKSNVHTISKEHKMKHPRKISRNKNIFHKKKKKKNRKVAVKINRIPFIKTTSIKNEMDVRTLLKNILSNSSNVKSFLQGTKKLSSPKKKETTESHVTKHVSNPVDIKDLLKSFRPSVPAGSVNLVTTTPRPTVQPIKETTLTPDHDIQILSVLRKLGVQINHNASTTNEAENQPIRIKPKASVGMKTSFRSKGILGLQVPSVLPLQHEQRKTSDTSTLNINQHTFDEIPTKDASLRSYIPNAKRIQSNSVPTLSPSPRPSASPPMYISRQQSNVMAIPQSQRGAGYLSRYSNPDLYQKPLINILCFGDSLTSGYYNHGRGKHPYSIRLDQILNAEGNHRFKIVTRGVVGEMAHESMRKRLPKVLNEGTRFEWVLILGGTNDVSHVKNFGDDEEFTQQLISVWSPKIVKDIENLHQTALSYGARTVLMTIPETAYEAFRSIRNMRLSVNAALRVYATQVRDTTVLCDLAIKLPRSSLSKELEKRYWNDHIHLNPVGYDKMAEIIGQCIQPYLNK